MEGQAHHIIVIIAKHQSFDTRRFWLVVVCPLPDDYQEIPGQAGDDGSAQNDRRAGAQNDKGY